MLLDIDLSLLSGFDFACRPGCGLCCFTSPRLEPGDAARIAVAAPDARIVREGAEPHLAARPDGGACQFLAEARCGIHGARPAPCREFPISVHVGRRLQATLVLSCPGLGLDPLRKFRPADLRPFSGLDTELDSVRARLTPGVERRRLDAERRRRRLVRALTEEGRWVDEEEVRRQLANRPLLPGPEEYRLEQLPGDEEGIEYLPMFYDDRAGPVALREGLGGWEALELSAAGGARELGLTVPPQRPPELERSAEALLAGYLRYWLERDAFLAAVALEMTSSAGGTITEAALDDLHAIGSTVLARASVRAKMRGADGTRLGPEDIERGIRAVDQDWLDRPTWGSRL